MPNIEPSEYKLFIKTIKQKIQSSQIKASIKVNDEMLRLYWDIAEMIVQKQKKSSWGDGVIGTISSDLKKEFPDMRGFSVTNIKYMRRWYLYWSQKSPQVVDELDRIGIFMIPWGHNREIIVKCKDYNQAIFYVQSTIELNWSRAVMLHHISTKLYEREGKAVTNFKKMLPKPQSDLAVQTIKDPYSFDFLTIRKKHDERELEDALMDKMTDFLLELGSGFAFVGRQYRLVVGGEEFRIDLLFYHIKLRCYVVVELKSVKFRPEFTGQLSFYVSAVDGEIKEKADNPTIGILICASKNNTVVEYALKSTNSPIGVSEYQLSTVLPKELKSSLPSIEEIEEELDDIEYRD